MRKLFLKGFIFISITFSAVAVIIRLSTIEPFRSLIAGWTASEDFMGSSGMLPHFERARESDGSTRLIIGDSIANQLFSALQENNPETDILTANAALMITGQYLLADEYLKSHPDATDIYLVMHPLTLTRTFDTEWSYRYAVMTYVETDTISSLDQNTLETMEDVYGAIFMRKEIVSLIEDSPVCRKLCLSYINANKEDYVQQSPFEITDQYVRKLYDLCTEHHVTLHIYPSPVSEYYKNTIPDLAEEYENTWMSVQFPEYFDQILFYPEEWSEDKSHFSGEHMQREKLNEIIRNAYGQDAMGGLRLE